MAPGETIALENMARVLFAAIVDTPKIPQALSTTIASVAYLLTEKMEGGIMENMANHISLHIKDTLDSLTSDLHVRLDQHVQAMSATAQNQSTLTDKLVQAQEKLEETTQKALTTTKTYSQVAATIPTMTAHGPTPPTSLTQLRLQNREEIKKRQVLIDFDRTQELHLEEMNEVVLARKAKDAISTAWAVSPDPKPTIPKIKAATLMRNGGLLLELDKAEAAEWLCKDDNRTNFLNNVGSGASIKDRTYQVIVQFIPIIFKPEDDGALRHFESINGLQPNSILKAEWIKPIKDRREDQRVATARFYYRDAKSANATLSRGAFVLGKKVIPKKPRKEPMRCLKCQLFGHERRHCTATVARCAKCARSHETDECVATARTFLCSNCAGRHPSYDRFCPVFKEKCDQQDARSPENGLAFYPTDEPWSWVTFDSRQQNQPQQGRWTDNRPPNNHYTDREHPPPTGVNSIPIGRPHPMNEQSQQDPPQ